MGKSQVFRTKSNIFPHGLSHDLTVRVLKDHAHAASDLLEILLRDRQAIYRDPKWNRGRYYQSASPADGLALARMIAHITYLSEKLMHEKFGRRLKDNGKEFILKAELPGVTKDGVDITIHGDSIEIDARRESATEEEHEGYYFKEIGKSSYYRRIPLPEEVEAEKAQGKLENGVLELTLPKMKPSEGKGHKVKL